MCLRVLKFSGDVVQFSVFYKFCSGLMVVEAYTVFDALCMNGLYPGIITDPGSGPGFSAHGYTLDDRVSVR